MLLNLFSIHELQIDNVTFECTLGSYVSIKPLYIELVTYLTHSQRSLSHNQNS